MVPKCFSTDMKVHIKSLYSMHYNFSIRFVTLKVVYDFLAAYTISLLSVHLSLTDTILHYSVQRVLVKQGTEIQSRMHQC